MTVEANKKVALRFYEEIFNRGNIDAADELVAPDVVDHNAPPGLPPGLEGAKLLFGMFHTAFSQLHVTVDDLIAEGDKVVARGTMRGTHTGPFMNIPPTGKEFEIDWIDIYRIANGKQVEVWHLEDVLKLLQQLGAIPMP
ncbi:MAG TPA: ester cyclase [Herpetosiphonaceae bacterium]|nr:ester cyclase [Herpetosiphonaceae bacterium]